MGTVADKLQYLGATKEAIKEAIEAKGVEVGNAKFRDYADKIAEISGGGGGAVVDEMSDLLFIDFDGTPVKGYTKAEALALTALPEAPDHSGDMVPLTFDGWNWTLEDIKTQMREVGECIVGAMYYPTDGYTHFIVEQKEDGENSWGVSIYAYSPSGVTIDWGDGNVEEKSSSIAKHTYASSGIYDIKISGAISIGSYADTIIGGSIVTDVMCSNEVSSIRDKAFLGCYTLRRISMPSSVNSIPVSSFSNCASLNCFVVPSGIKTIGASLFNACRSLRIVSLPIGVNSIGESVFSNCASIMSIALPFGIKSIPNNFARTGYSLQKIVFPPSVTSIDTYVLLDTYSLYAVKLMPKTPPTLSSTNSFNTSYQRKFIVPKGSLYAYQSASNWSTFASLMEEADE